METTTQLNGVRIAPRKMRAVVDLIKRKGVPEAIDQLEHYIRKPAPTLLKLLHSAVANAENNFHMVRENLYIKSFFVNEGIKLKRFMPRAYGRAGEIQKKSSKVTLVLDERVAGMRKAETPKPKISTEKVEKHETESESKKPQVKRETGKKENMFTGLRKKIFQRKAI